MWRPKWILDREFEDENGNVISRDRIYLKLRSDHTIKLYRSNNRPILEMFRKATEKKQKTKVFETGDEEVKSAREQVRD
ncbi:hypothetical protein EON65_38870 [archaeon]|nr:MAG: hypothetical protein EON65_38870 [archaeon]